MRRLITLTTFALAATLAVPPTWAGSPHFVTISVTRSGNSLTVSGKEAGLGNEPQVHIVITASASCVNPGDNHPKAANKVSVSAQGDFPVQNGRATFTLTLTPTFQPDCTPPMTVVFTDIVVTDATSGISTSFPGTF
jgi:hypothetical protein